MPFMRSPDNIIGLYCRPPAVLVWARDACYFCTLVMVFGIQIYIGIRIYRIYIGIVIDAGIDIWSRYWIAVPPSSC